MPDALKDVGGISTLHAPAAQTAQTSRIGLPASYDADRALVGARMREILVGHEGDVAALCRFHLGWADEAGRPIAGDAGKMLRPTLCLAVCRGYGDAGAAVVAVAAALELLHAFSLVHDDIEDADDVRHGRPTLWKLAGLPLALNAGDYLFALANRALQEAMIALPPRRGEHAFRLFSDAYLHMIEGQHLDIAFEQSEHVQADEYSVMARGKTGALYGAALALGALCGGAEDEDVETLREAGVELGLAFQAIDDALAIWGDPALTGKAVGNDLARGKKSLPVVLAGERDWLPDGAAMRSPEHLASRFDRLGVREAVERFAATHAEAARTRLEQTRMNEDARREIDGVLGFVVSRQH